MMALMTASLIAHLTSSLIQPVASPLVNTISGKGQVVGFLPLLALPIMMKVLGKRVRIFNKIKDKSIAHNIFRIQFDDSIT